MKLTRYICTHCGRRFEAEEKEILECPGCYWSTSVKKEEDFQEQPGGPQNLHGPGLSRRTPQFTGLFKIFLYIFLFAAFVGGLVSFWPALKKFAEIQKDWAGRWIEAVPRLKPDKISLKGNKQEQKSQEAGSLPPRDPLTSEEKIVLNRSLQMDPNRVPSEEEKRILEKRSPFQTGLVEKLPSQAWTVPQFREMLAGQEKFYQVPLPRSYKNKLFALFETKYVPGAEAFKNSDLLAARNFWIEALAFPIYANNIEKHRGVVLTMLRPFIADTLSKIGVINRILIERQIREEEKQVSERYENLLGLIEKKSWEEALNAISSLQKGLDELAEPEYLAAAPPLYPPAVRQIDQGIAATLAQLLEVTPPALADLEPLRADILLKQRVIETFIPERVQAVQSLYDEALQEIQRSQWTEAAKKLQRVDFPLALAEDAQQKSKVLKKLQGEHESKLDLPQKSS